MKRKILVTGANGHIGSNIVRSLLERGDEVAAFVRPGADLSALAGLEVELCRGDVLDRASLDAALAGRQGVIHAAANYASWARDAQTIARPAVEGTEHLLRAAAAAGLVRVVCTSSCVAAGTSGGPGQLRSEADWSDGSQMPYQQAKLDAERRAWRLADELGLELVTILPTLVLGAGDYRITPSTKAVIDIASGKAPTFPGGANVVWVGDVARAHVAALDRSVPVGRYLVGGENLSIRQVGALIAEVTGRQPKHLALPAPLLAAIASLMELGARLTGREPGMTRAFVKEVIGRYGWFDCSKARTVLGIEPKPAREVIAETLSWARERGLLGAEVSSGREASLGAAVTSSARPG